MDDARPMTADAPSPAPGRPAVCPAYLPLPGAYDEMFREDGEARGHWQPFLSALNRMGCGDLERCRQEVMRILRENGIAYNIQIGRAHV